MKISIDTKHDSHEDIRKVISILQHLLGDQNYAQTPTQSKDLPDASPGMFDMFNDAPITPTTPAPLKDYKEPNEDEEDDNPGVITY